jgi:plastocyanin
MSTSLVRILFLVALLAPIPAIGGNVVVDLVSDEGVPVADAVVAIRSADGAANPQLTLGPAPSIIDQRDEQFLPLVTLLPLGGEIAFKNSDRTRHHVYSFSSVKPFEFVLNPGKQSPPVTLEQPGVAAIGCNIHDRMVAYVFVSDTPWAVLSRKDGRAVLSGIPDGKYSVKIWHPRLKSGDAEPQASIEIANSDASTKFTLSLNAERPHGAHRREY